MRKIGQAVVIPFEQVPNENRNGAIGQLIASPHPNGRKQKYSQGDDGQNDQNHLVIKSKVESLTMNSKEVKAVYDRQ